MPREKQYYGIDEIISGQYTFGNEYMYTDGTNYIGLYHRYITTKEVYTEAKWDNKSSKKLIPFIAEYSETKKTYKKLNNLKTSYNLPKKYFVSVTPADIQKRYIKRYFLYKINEQQVTEISLKQYNKWYSQELDNNIYDTIELIWYISGPAFDTIDGNVKKVGVINKNQSAINRTNREYPGFNQTVNNPLELYVDTTVIVPPDIN